MDDAFADLQLTDPEDDQPEMSSREARIARAFDESKKSYSSETVVTPPGWFQVETVQPPGDLSKLDARHLETVPPTIIQTSPNTRVSYPLCRWGPTRPCRAWR
ncbi:hypothetical protein AG1IA_10051 [Rhizoctonia solani AG-1 IA]|uniref:Uncharacterized protein n=1 Tax=Thanatephorus cucumeris (strain AG1-IA) TaxID=983506 RepID=L8WHR7_THACA|nr:hypothetical protein AG1IA_10051 [Rhizoctonia solani AG-1 IA]